MTDLERELKALIIDSLNLEDTKVEDIDSNAPLFGDGLGLDSIDALELGMVLKKKYNLSMSKNVDENKEYFSSVANLAAYIEAQKA